jgi:hypothetical protein
MIRMSRPNVMWARRGYLILPRHVFLLPENRIERWPLSLSLYCRRSLGFVVVSFGESRPIRHRQSGRCVLSSLEYGVSVWVFARSSGNAIYIQVYRKNEGVA